MVCMTIRSYRTAQHSTSTTTTAASLPPLPYFSSLTCTADAEREGGGEREQAQETHKSNEQER